MVWKTSSNDSTSEFVVLHAVFASAKEIIYLCLHLDVIKTTGNLYRRGPLN